MLKLLSASTLVASLCIASAQDLYSQAMSASSEKIANSSSPASVSNSRTISYALDRIDQRKLPLDNIYMHESSGSGVTVYVFDGGISLTHPELIGRVRRGYTAHPEDPRICSGHGTAVAGAIAGKTLGVAPEAQIVDVKIVKCAIGSSELLQDFIEAADWVIQDHRAHKGPALANWSVRIGTYIHYKSLDTVISKLRKSGISVVVSAGNLDISACSISPANARGAITVGSSSISEDLNSLKFINERRLPNTAWGPCVDIYAPGDSVRVPGLLDDLDTPSIKLVSGTSISTGLVSGAIALYLENHPSATPNEVESWLKERATLNVVTGSHSAVSRLLYVGNDEQNQSHFTSIIP